MQEEKKDVNKKYHFLQLLGLLFVKDHKIESQRNKKNKFEIDAVLRVTHIHHYFYRAWNYWRYEILNQDKTGSTKIWESMENKTRNNDHNIYERKHLRNFL